MTEDTVAGAVDASLIQTPPLVAVPETVAAFTQSASLEPPTFVAAFTVTEPAVTFGLPAFDPPLTPSSTEPVTEFKVALPLPAFTESTERSPWLPMTTGPPPVVTEATVTVEVEASLIHTPPVLADPEIVAAFTQSASLALPVLVAESTVTELAVMFGAPAFAPPLTPSSTAPAEELTVAASLPALIEPMSRSPVPPMTTGPCARSDRGHRRRRGRRIVDPDTTVGRCAGDIRRRSPQSASLGLPALVAALTVTEPAVTFGLLASEPPVTPSSTEPVAELKVALPLPAFTESIERSPWLPMTTGPPLVVTEDTVTADVEASLIQTPPLVAAAVMVGELTQSASLALPALVTESTVTDPAVMFGAHRRSRHR